MKYKMCAVSTKYTISTLSTISIVSKFLNYLQYLSIQPHEDTQDSGAGAETSEYRSTMNKLEEMKIEVWDLWEDSKKSKHCSTISWSFDAFILNIFLPFSICRESPWRARERCPRGWTCRRYPLSALIPTPPESEHERTCPQQKIITTIRKTINYFCILI